MKILLDECIDWRLSRDLAMHEVKTADIFVTVDRNLSFQQRLTGLPIAVIVLRSKSNRLADLKCLVSGLLRAMDTAKAGVATFVGES